MSDLTVNQFPREAVELFSPYELYAVDKVAYQCASDGDPADLIQARHSLAVAISGASESAPVDRIEATAEYIAAHRRVFERTLGTEYEEDIAVKEVAIEIDTLAVLAMAMGPEPRTVMVPTEHAISICVRSNDEATQQVPNGKLRSAAKAPEAAFDSLLRLLSEASRQTTSQEWNDWCDSVAGMAIETTSDALSFLVDAIEVV